MSKKTWGFIESQDGFKITDLDDFYVVLAGGGSAKLGANIVVDSGFIKLDVQNKLVLSGESLTQSSLINYITYKGTANGTFQLPATPVIGFRVDIMNPTAFDLTVGNGSVSKVLKPGDASAFIWNSENWISMDYLRCEILI